MFQLKVKRGLASQSEIQRRMTELKRKADIKGMVDSIRKNEQKDFSSHYGRSQSLKDRLDRGRSFEINREQYKKLENSGCGCGG